jgi:GH15 family glucan-1,4-alpha-glucosidase
MAWVAFDRAIKMHESFGMDGPIDHWKRLRGQIRDDVLSRGWNDARQSFTQAYGAEDLDASLLLIPIMGFLPANDPRVVSTVVAIQQELMADGLVLRYRPLESNVDGLPGEEGSFLACSFWLAEVFALQGRLPEARALLSRLESLQNDVGLLAEEYDPVQGIQLGNFPQAFSHLALVLASLTIMSGETR